MRNTHLAALALAALPAFVHAQLQPAPAMMRYADISADKVCFIYANDIWIAPKAGGMASPLASPPGMELHPKFSADGRAIAFIGNYDGNRDIYTIPAAGGTANRITHHPAGETLSDWGPDGGLLFFSNGLAGLQRQSQIFTVAADGGMPDRLPVPYGAFSAISPDGTWLAYAPHSIDNRTWKRYRGGMQTDIWLFNLKDNSARRITDWEGLDSIPMFIPGGNGSTVYYLSDNGPQHRLNIWAYDIAAGQSRQITTYADADIKWPSIGPGDNGGGEIIFQLGAELRVLDLATGNDRILKITIPGDRPNVRTRSVDAARNIGSASISPSGKRVTIQARGDLWSAPAKEGVVRNLTRTDDVFERDPSWSPDGKWIAYFSDSTGEYELWVRPADTREPEKKDDEKKENGEEQDEAKDGDDAKPEENAAQPADKPADKPAEEPKPEEKPEAKPSGPRCLTDLGAGFRFNPRWSPDSKHIVFADNGGVLRITELESGKTTIIDTDPWSNQPEIAWSHEADNSNWMVYTLTDEAANQTCIWLYNAKTGEKTRLTDPMFSSQHPAFDRAGDFLYFASNRSFAAPQYADSDTTWIYTGTELLYAVPLRADVKNPFLPKSDEEAPKKDEKKDDKADKKDEKKDGEKKDEPKESAAADDGISGTWAAKATGNAEGIPPDGLPFTLNLRVSAEGKVSGSVVSVMGSGKFTDGTFNKETGELSFGFPIGDAAVTMSATLKDGALAGTWLAGDTSGAWSATRAAALTKSDQPDDTAKTDDKKKDDKPLVIDLDGFERRAIQLPAGPGGFGTLAVNDSNKLIFVRRSTRGGAGGGGGSGEGAAIKIFDIKDDAKEEKLVLAGAGGFDITADGKKLLVGRAGGFTVLEASAGGGTQNAVPTAGMRVTIDPRDEWRQIVTDTWRLFRDFFYEPNMHNVDWKSVRDRHLAYLADAASREDVAYIQAEMVSELNIGHAYINSPGDVESAPTLGVGLLGCDFELVKTDAGSAYKISKIYEGAPWDADARGPLSQPGIKVKEGDFLLAVDGVPLDTSKDPWAALIDTADRVTALTVSDKPVMDGTEREILVKPAGGEAGLRFRAWIERNRAYVEEKTGGKVGYIYVPNTGTDGQNELYRQYVGQRGRAALIIDERWNGGGQIPTRFIELLNRPPTNYWAVRHGHDWPWPPDAHFGPKCMLINGLAGSGGDMFPWLFKHNKLGAVIGMRTWGGLVGISGNPGLIDGGAISVPTFGFYETDGTWGVEGHGVDPDIEVIDDPSKMLHAADPQLDAAIAHMLAELERNPYVPPTRPASPDRRGMGIPDDQK